MKKQQQNPFDPWRVHTDLVYGRESVISGAVDDIRHGRSAAIIGGRRIGKTTVLRKIEEIIRNENQHQEAAIIVIPIYLDLLSLDLSEGSGRIYRTILTQIHNECMSLGWLKASDANQLLLLDALKGEESRVFEDILTAWVKTATPAHLRFVLLFDEIEPVAVSDWGNGFFSNWRHILNNSPELDKHICAVFCGAREMNYLAEDVGSPLANILTWRPLGVLAWPAIRTLIYEHTSSDFPIAIARRLFVLTGGHPFLAQYFMETLWGVPNSDLHSALVRAERAFMSNHTQQFRAWAQKLSDLDLEVYAYLARQKGSQRKRSIVELVGDSGANSSLAALCNSGIAKRQSLVHERYRVAGVLFKDWFDREIRPTVITQTSGVEQNATRSLSTWLGAKAATLAVVFTDVVGSTALLSSVGNVAMDAIRRAHFERARKYIIQFEGCEVKTAGDSFMVAFKTAVQALDFCLSLRSDTGDRSVRIRAGIHVGNVRVEESDLFGATVNYASRVAHEIEGAEIWTSDRAKHDIDEERATQHQALRWTVREGVRLKGFSGDQRLWLVWRVDPDTESSSAT